MSDTQRYCRKCLLQDQAEDARGDLNRYLDAIHPEDKADEVLYFKRLEVCRQCELLGGDATCAACGCYVEFRAILARGKCPKSYWK
ncbi:MAG: DUF6171 family protein [Lachnospiraceae bacterium]|nr:DUF6171 family protein [Lachnospiraceae bacterium]